MTSFKAGTQLHDDRLLDVVPEDCWGGPSVVMMTLFPSLIIQQQVNSLSTRHIQPVAPGVFDFVWTHFGFADDDEAMTRRRLPLATLSFESRGRLQDRVCGALETIFHHPYSQRHIVGLPRLLARDGDTLRCEASYLVIRTPRDGMPEILSVGRYLDRVVPTAEGLRFAERLVIFDNDLIPNAIIDPI